MKKTLSILFVLLALLLAVPAAFAAESAQISVSVKEKQVNAGDTVTVTLNLSPVQQCTGGGIIVDFDQDIFEYVESESQMTVPGSQMAGLIWANDLLGAAFANGAPATVQGDIATIKLRVKQQAKPGNATISARPTVKVNDIEIPVETNTAQVCITQSDAKPTDPQNKPGSNEPAQQNSQPNQAQAAQPLKPTEEALPQKPRQNTKENPENQETVPQNSSRPENTADSAPSSDAQVQVGQLAQPQTQNEADGQPAAAPGNALKAVLWALLGLAAITAALVILYLRKKK